MVQKDDILIFLEEKKENLFQEFHLVKLGLFGSFARNEASDESDIDLIIEFEPDTAELSLKKDSLKKIIKDKFVGQTHQIYYHS